MFEWILVSSLVFKGPDHDLRDISFDTITGFSSKAKCSEAGGKIGSSFFNQINAYSEIKSKDGVRPAFRIECIKIEK